MAFLAAAVILVGILGFLNLALVLAVIRRVRTISANSLTGQFHTPGLLPVGSDAPAFTAITTAGADCELSALSGTPALLGFFSGACEPCRDHVPDFIKLANSAPNRSMHVIAVVRGDDESVSDLLQILGSSAIIIREPEDGVVGEAFSIDSYPTMYLLDGEGKIASAAHIPRALNMPVAV
jgi:thiol-disulfide isomerase/thioredoxin